VRPEKGDAGVALQRKRSRDRATRAQLAGLLLTRRRAAAAGALAGGLGKIRLRSSGERLAQEVEGFLDLAIAALEGRRVKSQKIRRELEFGSLVGASARQLRSLVALWIRTLVPLLADAGRGSAQLLRGALGRLELQARTGLRGAALRRIDVIVVGASAGGLEPLTHLLAHLRRDLPSTILVAQHMLPSGPSVLPAILGRSSQLTCSAAVEGEPLLLGHAYVGPPGWHLTIGANRLLHLSDLPPVHHVQPAADLLFASAAARFGRGVVSVVLSGTGSDGAEGTRVVHRLGGTTLAQSPDSARFRSMPEAAIATGVVDQVAPPGVLADTIRRLSHRGRIGLAESSQA
jgi:chemotaxis response regulator CheB